MDSPGVVDDEDPDQAGAQHAADHGYHYDPCRWVTGGRHSCTRGNRSNNQTSLQLLMQTLHQSIHGPPPQTKTNFCAKFPIQCLVYTIAQSCGSAFLFSEHGSSRFPQCGPGSVSSLTNFVKITLRRVFCSKKI